MLRFVTMSPVAAAACALLLGAPTLARAADTPPAPSPTAPAAAARETGPDWPNLRRYHDANAALPPPASGEDRVVFMGDSITDGWGRGVGTFFPGKPYVNRGISGQTTPQMLLRFRPDVIALKPKVVVINAGINDIAGNTGPTTLSAIEDNLMSMVDLAHANGIRVVLASVTPAKAFPWRAGVDPRPEIHDLNIWMKEYAAKHDAVYLDYYSALADADRGFKAELASDGVHPNAAGYEVMAPLAQKAIDKAMKKR
jgi:lysophospholipase L1-like esterase